jgi:hypothetical protein
MRLSLAFVFGSVPAVALACPACAQDATPHLLLLLGAMIAAPYAVAAVVVHVIRGGGR